MKLWSCPHCYLEVHSVDHFDVVVRHLWEEHRKPSRFEFNGEVFKAGPQSQPIKWIMNLLNKRK